MTQWEAALEEQVKLMRWWGTEPAAKYVAGFAEDVKNKKRAGVDFYENIIHDERGKLERAEPVFVDRSVIELLEHAMSSVRPEALNPDDLFTPEGFALMERPIALLDVNGKHASFRAFSWGPAINDPYAQQRKSLADIEAAILQVRQTRSDLERIAKKARFRVKDLEARGIADGKIAELDAEGLQLQHKFEDIKSRLENAGLASEGPTEKLHITLYMHWDDDDSYLTSAIDKELLGLIDVEVPKRMARDVAKKIWGTNLTMYHAAAFPWGEVPSEIVTLSGTKKIVTTVGELPTDAAGLNLWKFIQTFFRLAEQEIITPTRSRGDRHTRKRLKRLREDRDGILVVTLRRKKQPRHEDAEESNIEWTCQWPVSGHWRNQWYPSLGEHRQKWIGGYVKGPEDKPLRVHSGRAFEFRR